MRKTKTVIGMLMGAALVVGLAGPAGAGTPNQQIQIAIQFGGGAPTCSVVATGPVQGVGTCTIDEVSDTVTIVHMMLPDGTVTLRSRTVAGTESFDPQTCLFRLTFRDRFRIVGGTGAYAEATGNGIVRGAGQFVGMHTPEGCDDSQAVGAIGAIATGTVSLGGSNSAAA